MNLKAAFFALALSLPFAAASATVSSIASAEPIPAAQAAKPGPKEARIGEGKRGEHAKRQCSAPQLHAQLVEQIVLDWHYCAPSTM